ncbi:uncharacterized protein [Macrobrachium rosenbergii]|uniref:uncharacterized protein n=1 Tax=Macrobrachium rosenbergii TaxID=79674 RepID=UPI0034D76249
MDWRCVIAPLLMLLLADQGEGLCSLIDFTLRGMTMQSLSIGEALIYCTNVLYEQFSNGLRTMIVDCSAKEPLSPDISCVKPSGDLLPICDAPGPPPYGLSYFVFSVTLLSGGLLTDRPVYMSMTCSDLRKKFISGTTVIVSQCINGNWTPYNEWCELPCAVPRDCSEIVAISDGSSGLYRVTPSGADQDEAVDVWCEMTEPQGGGTGWTTMYRHVGTNFTEKNINYTTGFGDPELTWTNNSTYFVGFTTLVKWSSTLTLLARDLVFQFMLADVNGIQYHATYGGVRINPLSVDLMSVGRYHGNAGDAFSSHVGMPLSCSEPSICFWAVAPGMAGINFTSTGIRWKDMPLSYIHIRVRPTSFDLAEGCPTQFRGEKTEGTVVDLPLSRLPNTTFNIACHGDFQLKPKEGNVNCIGAGGSFSWDILPDLPCKYRPPPGFTAVPPGNRSAVKAVDAVVRGGLSEASSSCADMNSSLLTVDSVNVLVGMTSGLFYFTAHTFRNGSVVPPLIPGLTCSAGDTCQADDTYACIVVDNTGRYKAVTCNSSNGFLCSHPGSCISGYSLHKGQCYKIISANGDMHQALDTCVAEGSALAYPETMSTLEFLAQLLTAQLGNGYPPQDIIIALQDRNGSYASYYGHNPDPDVIAMASGVSDRWYQLTVTNDGNFSLSQSQLTGGTALFAACHYLGRTDCPQDPPPSDTTRNSTWDGVSRALKTKVNYTCAPDTYAGEHLLTVQVSTCKGQLGGWTAIKNCTEADLCLSEFPPAPPNVTMTPNVTSRRLNGVVSYDCPPEMATADGNTTQIVKCLKVLLNRAFQLICSRHATQ